MIEEQFVSFDTARMLKEAGFRELTKTHYSNSGQIWETAMPADYNDDFNCNTCNRPTQALAARWLREVHHYAVCVWFSKDHEKWFYAHGNMDSIVFDTDYRISEFIYETYEEALEAGLQEAIKLIKAVIYEATLK